MINRLTNIMINRLMIARVIAIPVIIASMTAAPAARANAIDFFPPNAKTLSAETLPFAQMLHTGTEGEDFYARGRFGVDFNIVGYTISGEQSVNFGITAGSHINMLPNSDMYFPVDNFYATLAFRFSGAISQSISWRLYPVYHVSAHLADGYRGGDVLKAERLSISSEMIRGEAYYKPFGDILELGAGGGWYYHVCSQRNLKYRGDVSILLTPFQDLRGGMIKPFALLRAENVFQSGHNPGGEVSGGVFIMKSRRGFGLSLRYFNHMHRSYYYDKYEKGYGADYMFVY